MTKERSLVAISDSLDVAEAVNEALSGLNGLEQMLKGKHVAVKPNDTWASPDDLTACTQPDTLRAVLRRIKDYSPSRISVSGGAGAEETENVFRYLALDRVIEEEDVEFFDHNRPPFREVKLEYGVQETVMVNPAVFRYDTLISLAQHKVHHSAGVTLTLKNIALSYPAADYYGHPRLDRKHRHSFFEDLHAFIAGMCRVFTPDLGIIAGHPAMIEKGPTGGKTFESGLVIAGTDPVAVDRVGAELLGEGEIRHISEADRLGIGVSSIQDIRVAGISLSEAVEKFRERAPGVY